MQSLVLLYVSVQPADRALGPLGPFLRGRAVGGLRRAQALRLRKMLCQGHSHVQQGRNQFNVTVTVPQTLTRLKSTSVSLR